MKFSGYVGHDSRNNLKIWEVVCLTPCIQVFFLYVFKEIRDCEHYNGKIKHTDFHEIFSERSDKEHSGTFSGLAVNSLNPGSIFLCSGSVGVSEILEKRVNGFS